MQKAFTQLGKQTAGGYIQLQAVLAGKSSAEPARVMLHEML